MAEKRLEDQEKDRKTRDDWEMKEKVQVYDRKDDKKGSGRRHEDDRKTKGRRQAKN